MRPKEKKLFESHIHSSNNIATFNRFAALYNNEMSLNKKIKMTSL